MPILPYRKLAWSSLCCTTLSPCPPQAEHVSAAGSAAQAWEEPRHEVQGTRQSATCSTNCSWVKDMVTALSLRARPFVPTHCCGRDPLTAVSSFHGVSPISLVSREKCEDFSTWSGGFPSGRPCARERLTCATRKQLSLLLTVRCAHSQRIVSGVDVDHDLDAAKAHDEAEGKRRPSKPRVLHAPSVRNNATTPASHFPCADSRSWSVAQW